MPFNKFERPPPIPQEEKTPDLKKFSSQEIREIIICMGGKGLSSHTLSKINIKNIDWIIALGTEEIRKECQKINKKTFSNLETAMEELSMRSSAPHGLYCVINGKEDFKAFYKLIENFVEKNKIKESDERISYLKEVTQRQIEMGEILEELFKIVIKQTVGKFQKNESFFSESIPQIENCGFKISRILEYFKKEEIQSKSKEIKKLTEKIETVLNLIKDKKTDLIKNQFYDFCLNLGLLNLIDFEELNEGKMKETVKSLVGSYEK